MHTNFIFALFVGMIVPLQAPLNAFVARSLGSPLWATLVSLSVSVMATVPLLMLFRVSAPELGNLGQVPWYGWLGGLCGVVFVASSVILAPKIGIANFAVLAIAGQMIGALVLDHFGFFGLSVKPINLFKVLGVAVMLGGILLVQYGNRVSS
ncbi:DMT family transporter [Neisseria animalis]|uniref:DMT family transporter n=1 Tax=Neisseria animalis TaxID=492 RepID=A0A5P3MR07_NEIAN|nr:DMT family transporter [Neisseria animalis]QEY23958.1 DMT family transporter [Neisseria animalis]ROW31644.1 DMT family transporter [Neisseria animalis]VEE05954.1 Uncharacterized protein conserved in bacteria [Neisseria animalis]